MGNFLVNDFGDQYLHEINGASFNHVGSWAFYQSYFPEDLFAENSFYLIAGSDSGLLAKYLYHRGVADTSQYIFVEPESVLNIIQSILPVDLPSNINLCSLEELPDLCDEKKLMAYILLGRSNFYRSLASIDCIYPAYRGLTHYIEQYYQQTLWLSQVHFSGFYFLEQQLKNIAENRLQVNQLENACTGKQAIILAGGPSLDDILPWVIEHHQQLIIIAVSRISQRLKDVGLLPDFIISIDPTEKMFDVSCAMLEMDKSPVLIHSEYVISTLLAQWPGKKMHFGQTFPWANDDNLVTQGPTVTNAAVSFALLLGIKEILLAGVDLCYSKEGFSHAKGSREAALGPNLGFNGHPVKLNDGSEGETESGFFAAINVLGQQAQLAAKKQCRIINLSSRAAQIDTISYQSLAEVRLFGETIDKESVKERVEADTQKNLTRHYQYCLEEVNSVKATLKKIIRTSKECLLLNKDFVKKPQLGKKITALENGILRQEKIIAMIKQHNYHDFAQLCHAEVATKLSAEDVQQSTDAYFSAIIRGAKNIIQILDDTANRIESRLAEHAEPLDESVINQWRQDNQCGRIRLWLNFHGHLQSDLIDSLQQAFQQQLDVKPLTTTRDFSQLTYVRNIQHKLHHCYRDKDNVALKNIIFYLEKEHHESAQLLCFLAKGYLAELNQDVDQAVENYYQAAKGHLQEVALSHLASCLISNQDAENAWLALQCLSQIAPGYLPQYAHLSHLLGRHEDAVNAYEIYLKQVPNDPVARERYQQLQALS